MKGKIVLDSVTKVFGDNPDAALALLDDGHDKEAVYGKTGHTVGVQDASFSVGQGEIFVVMGLSGCGKSTLVRMINRLIEPTRGSVSINGRDVTTMKANELIDLRRREVSMVFQSFALMPHLSVRDNAGFGLDIAAVDPAERADRIERSLDTVGLSAVADAFPNELSGGMQQRVGLARALALDPEILLMDEAFSALDPLIRKEMQDELLRLQDAKARTVVFISHDLDEAFRIGDRIAVMQGGRIVQVGRPRDIVQSPANDYVASFFKGVDLSKVFKAADIAHPPDLEVSEPLAGGMRALQDQLAARDLVFAYVSDADGRFHGVVSAPALDQVLNGDAGAALGGALVPDVRPIAEDEPIENIVGPVAAALCPLPVLDPAGRLVGVVSKEVLLETLDKAM